MANACQCLTPDTWQMADSSFSSCSLSVSLQFQRPHDYSPPFDLARCPTAVRRETSGTTTSTCTSTWPSLIRRSRGCLGQLENRVRMAFLLLCRPAPSTRLTDNDCVPWCLSASVLYFLKSWGQGSPCWGLLFLFLLIWWESKPSFWVVLSKKQIQDTLKCREPVGSLKLIKKLAQLSGIILAIGRSKEVEFISSGENKCYQFLSDFREEFMRCSLL